MDPFSMIGGGLGAVGGVVSGIMGAQAASEASDTNWEIALLNYYARNRERQDRIQEAASNKRDTKLGFTDGEGSTSKFVEGQGWVTQLADRAKQIQDLQRGEQKNVLQHDMPMKRRSMDRNEARSLEDESTADSLRRNMRDLQPGDDSQLENLLLESATHGLNRGYDEATGAAVREAARTDSSNTPRILSSINKDRAESYAKAGIEAKLKAHGSGDKEYQQKRDSLANLYNMFATRASVGPDVSFKPEQIGKTNDLFASQGSKQQLGAGNSLADAFGAKGGTMDYTQPNYGPANAMGGGASALAGMFRGMAGQGFGGSASSSNTPFYQDDNKYTSGYDSRLIS